MAEGTEICFTCLFGPKDVENAILGENGIASTMPPGGVCIDMTTIDMETALHTPRGTTQKNKSIF